MVLVRLLALFRARFQCTLTRRSRARLLQDVVAFVRFDVNDDTRDVPSLAIRVPRQNQNGRLMVDRFLVDTTQSTCVGDDLSARPRTGVGLSRPPRTGARESRASPATERVETREQPSTPPEARSAVLDHAGPDVAELARGARARSAGHRGAMAPRLAPPALDTALGAASCGPPEDQRRHSHAGQEDGRGESALERLGSMASWAEWVSRSRSEPSRGCCRDRVGRRHRRGAPF